MPTHRLAVPVVEHRALLDDRQAGYLSHSKPGWVAGDDVIVTTLQQADDRRSEEPTRMRVREVEPVMICDLTQQHARTLGLRLVTDIRRVALNIPSATAQEVNMAARGTRQTVWLTTWTPVAIDEVRLVDAGMQAPTPPLQFRPIDAGEGVDRETLRAYAAAGAAGIAARTAAAASVTRAIAAAGRAPWRQAS
ncbi:MAG: hypothetical protein QM679_02965 [Patulibacter sp.]